MFMISCWCCPLYFPTMIFLLYKTSKVWNIVNLVSIANKLEHDKMSLVTRKPVIGISNHVLLKPACAATEANKRLEISDLETRGVIISRQCTTKMLIRLRGCTG